MIKAVCNYYPIKAGLSYRLIEENEHYYLIAIKGRPMYAFRWVFDE